MLKTKQISRTYVRALQVSSAEFAGPSVSLCRAES